MLLALFGQIVVNEISSVGGQIMSLNPFTNFEIQISQTFVYES